MGYKVLWYVGGRSKIFVSGLTILKEWRILGLLKEYAKGSEWEVLQWVDCENDGLIKRKTG